jgi:hypothetical protein
LGVLPEMVERSKEAIVKLGSKSEPARSLGI